MRKAMKHHRRFGPGAILAAALWGLGAPDAHAGPEDDDLDYDASDFDDDEGEAEDPLDDEMPDDGDDDESGASASASVSLGGGAEGKGKAGKGKRKKGKKKDRPKREKPTGPWIERYAPENHMVELGIYMGAIIVANNHGLFDPGEGPQPSLNRSAFDIGFRAAYMPLRFLGVGLETGVMPTRSPSEGDTRANMFTVRGHVIAQLPWYRITPTLVLGGGGLGIRSDAAILNSGDAAFHWGPGVRMFINDWIAARIDGRHIVAGQGNDGQRQHHGEILFGVDVTLRLKRWIGDDAARNVDSDGDLVPDRVDQCPDVYGEDDVGCPLDKDSDKDGVPDKRDSCPKEWGDQPNGCPIKDSDGDGILDTSDQCENEPENFNGFEDKDGCPDEPPEEIKRLTGVIEGIYFASGKATIRTKSRGALNKVVETLEKYPEIRLEISGHTDDTGSKDLNMELSQARADAVKDYLVEKGIDESRLETKGYGPENPVADNKTKAGRAKNRRIEFKTIP